MKSCMTTRDGVNWISTRLFGRIPIEQCLDVLIRDVGTIDVTHQVLDQYLQRVRQMIDAVEIAML